MPPETQTNVPEVKDPNRELTPDELREELSRIKHEYCTKLGDELGVRIVFPQGTMIGSRDFSGLSLEDALNSLIAPLENYEPPIVQRQVELGHSPEKEKQEVPPWLKGHEDLVWTGAHENPIWGAQSNQYDKDVRVSYVRRGKELRPGKTEAEQGRDLEPVENTFTVSEWNVVKQLFDHYVDLEKDLQNPDEEKVRAARAAFREILAEENVYRKGKSRKSRGEGGEETVREPEVPKIIRAKLEEALEQVARTKRGFKKDSIDVDALSQRSAEMLSQLLVLNRTRGDGREKVPKVKADIKEIPSFEYSMEELTRCLDTQNKSQKGLSLMIGEAGTGKNEAVSHFAAKTNRPFFWFPCGRGMEAIDMVTHYEFDSKEGTKRFMTALSEGLQTPGAVVMVDEVNSLKPEVQAILHGLGDSNRALNYDGVFIPAAEGVLIIIAGNPATYGSAGNFGEALLSRTRGQSMVMEYPALRKGELTARKEHWSQSELTQKETEDNTLRDYACDEALVLFSQLNEFSSLKDEEFALLWDCVINEVTQGNKIDQIMGNEKLKTLMEGTVGEHIKKTLIDLRDILRIADNWRKNYEKRTGGFDLIGVSMRDTIALVKRYKDLRDVKKTYLSIIDDFRKNPIEGLDSVALSVEQLVDQTLQANP